MNKRTNSERGQALILITFSIVALIGLTGLAVDGNLAYSDRRQAQNAADSAAMSAALAYVRGEDVEAAALQAAAQNGCPCDESHEVFVHNPPVSGPYAGNQEYIQVMINTKIQTSFASIVGVTEINNHVEAISRTRSITWDNMSFGNAVVSLKPDDRGAMRSHGDNNISTYGGGIFVNSNDSCAFEQVGNSVVNSPSGMSLVGNACLNGSIDPATSIVTGVDPIPYPPVYLPPEPICSEPAVQTENYLSPGYWEGNFPPRGVTVLQSGIYCIDGMFMVNAHDVLIGDEVMIYMQDGNIHWDGGAQINLTAPQSGAYEDLLIYMPMDNNEGIILNGNSDSTFIGTIFAPASDIQLNGTMSSESYHSQIIGYTIDLIGTADIVINFNEDENYKVLIPPAVELAQ